MLCGAIPPTAQSLTKQTNIMKTYKLFVIASGSRVSKSADAIVKGIVEAEKKADELLDQYINDYPSDTYIAFTPARNDVIKEHYDIIHFHSMNGRHLYLTYKAAMRVLRRNEKSIKLIGIELA